MTLITEREKEILKLIVRGYSNEEIGKMMNISKHTVKAHISSILHKLNIQTRAELCFMVGKGDLF